MATPTQIRRRGRFSLILGTLVAALMVVAVAYADPVDAGATATLKDKTSGSTAFSNDVNVDASISMVHCPPGGDEDAVDVYMSNTSSSGPWTLVHDGNWPNGNCSTADLGPATFSWTLASGDGAKTVHVQLKHGTNATVISDSITLDTTPPVITDDGPTPSSPNGSNGWYVSAVSNAFSASDGGSGLDATCAAAFPKNVSTGTNEGSSVKVNSGPCSDVAGNTNSGIDSAAFMIDLSDPSVAITSPSDGSSTSDSSITVSGTASDAVSGLTSVNLIVNGTALGTNATLNTGTWSQSGVALQCGSNTIKARATDNAGRTKDSAEITVTRNCVTYTFAGFHGGVGAENKAKAGQGVSLRWNLYQGATEITSTSGYTLSSVKITCDQVGTGDAVPTADDAGSSALRYDLDAGQYVFVWKTLKDWANTCRRFDVTYNGVTLSAEFRFTR